MYFEVVRTRARFGAPPAEIEDGKRYEAAVSLGGGGGQGAGDNERYSIMIRIHNASIRRKRKRLFGQKPAEEVEPKRKQMILAVSSSCRPIDQSIRGRQAI